MSSTHKSQIEVTEAPADEQVVGEEEQPNPEVDTGPIPLWLVWVIALGVFWAGAYLFSFSGGFSSDVFDFQPKFGVVGGAQSAPDPKVVGKALFSANCITCHQATGLGVPGQYPPLAGSEVETGEATNHLIAIVMKGLQGPVTIKGMPFNNSMQAWEGQYTDQQIAAILTYVRSDWGNNAPPITADMVKEIRADFKDRKDQWTWPEIEKMPAKNMTGGSGAPPAGKGPAPSASPGNQPPAPSGQPQAQPKAESQPPAPGASPSNAS